MRPDRPRYTFGDSPRAARRLELLSDVLAPSTRAFLADAAPVTPRVALDLGCGPGVSTRLVADVTGARRTIGVDTSRSFLELAARSAPRGVEFVRHDATRVPLPEAPADLIYCRLLLAHVTDPVATVRAWASQLAPRGRLLVDEMEWIDAPHPVLAAYESIVVDLVASRGAPMYAGPRLAAMHDGPGWRQRSSAVRAVPVATPAAARIYEMNLMTWRTDPQIRDHHSVETLDDLARDLAALAQSTSADQITWGVRQLAYERDPSAPGEP